MTFSRLVGALAFGFAVQFAMPSVVAADEVLDWNTVAVRAMQVPPATPANLQQRLLAIVHVSIFDALNGIDRRYVPIHVDSAGPPGASRRAAVVQAAYRALTTLLPAQDTALNSDLATSLAAIAMTDSDDAIRRGRDWGDQVAVAILRWRAADKTLQVTVPPYEGSLAVGKWRPTPRPNPVAGGAELPGLPGAAPLLGSSQPFVIPAASSFRPAGPPALTSAEYAMDVDEVKRVGAVHSVSRTADQTESARFWAGAGSSVWNRAAASASRQRNFNLSENARLFALLNMATADAIFAAWDAKYHFELWRPIHAIRLADTDSNPSTIADPQWVPLIATPNYPEYDSGHQSVSGAAQEVLTAVFGNRMGFEGFSEGLPGVVRSWNSFSEAADEALEARIWSGIHFRSAMRDTRNVAEKVAQHVLQNAARPAP